MPEPSACKTPFWKDSLLLAAELTARNIYWRAPWLRHWAQRRRARRPVAAQVADRAEFKDYLRSIGVVEGALVMVHTSTTGVSFTERSNVPPSAPNTLLTAKQLVDDLMELVGPTGTLVMPTHAAYQTEESEKGGGEPTRYDPATTPCNIGLANELFRRRKGVQRSLYPFNMVSACGPLAEELLKDNLNDSKPLPHGVYSPHYRLCQKNGLVVSIGVPLGQCVTLVHAAEDCRDEQWPVKDFFEEKTYVVRIDGRDQTVVVRHQRPEYSMFCRCRLKSIRDLVGDGVIHEGMVGTVRVDWAHSREVFDYLTARNEKSPYPFYCTWLVGKKNT